MDIGLRAPGTPVTCFPSAKDGFIICDGVEFQLQHTYSPSDYMFWIYLGGYVLLALLAGFVAGLIIGLLSLDALSLRVVAEGSTDPRERWAAKKIYPLVERHHYVLSALVIAGSIALVGMPMLLHVLADEITAIVVSATVVLVFGEIIPQAICARHGLIIAAYVYPCVIFLIILFFPVVLPLALLLDFFLGHERDTFYGRRMLKALVALHGPERARRKAPKPSAVKADGDRESIESKLSREQSLYSLVNETYGDNKEEKKDPSEGPLAEDEVMLIQGAMNLTERTARDAMIALEDVFMLSMDEKLSRATLELIGFQKFSRVPVYDGSRNNVKKVLLVKTLLAINPEDKLVIRKLPAKHLIDVDHIEADTKQYDVLQHFQSGAKGHLAVVVAKTAKLGETKKAIGIITLEDILEELLQEEIYDEMDNTGRGIYTAAKRISDKKRLTRSA